MNAPTPGIGHNGGPPILDDNGRTLNLKVPNNFLPLFSHYRHKAFHGGRGTAKSHSFATALVVITSRRQTRIVCARQFQNSIRDSVKELLELKMREMHVINQFSIYEREIVHKATESRYTFIGLDRNPASAKSLEGADICWVEEARTINKHSFEILLPTIRKPGSELWWSWNPEFREDPVDKYFRGPNGPPPMSIVQHVTIKDNPYFYQTALAQESEFMLKGNPKRYEHIWGGGYDDDYESKVFSNIVIGRCDIPDYVAPRYGMDFGFGQDPSAIIKLYVIEATKQIYIAREAFGRVPLAQLPAMMDSVVESRDDYIKADSSQPGTIEHLDSQGFRIEGARKGPGSVKSGINWLQGYQIVIDPNCENMRDEARLYSWQVDKITRQRLSVPVDTHNHGWDAVRYATEDSQTEEGLEDEDDGVIRSRF